VPLSGGEAEQHVDRRRLAGAVGAEQRDRLARARSRTSMPRTAIPDRALRAAIVDVISMALRFEGFTVDSAGSGADAIAAVAANKPQVMVLDVMLPDFDGFEVARRLASARTGIPILFLTARDATEDIVHGLTLGGDDYMTKPFSLEELIARIRTILRRNGLTEPESSKLAFADLELDEDTRESSAAADRSS
jgi:two-component system OmpR family response regulator